MTMPNHTYEMRKLYLQQNQYSAENQNDKDNKLSLFQWPANGYFKSLKPDIELFQTALQPENNYKQQTVSEKIFGNEIKQQYCSLKHIANLLRERSQLHEKHIKEINSRDMDVQEKLFGVQINNNSDQARRLSNLEGHLAQLDKERREEELAFWRDTVELREKLFEGADNYRGAKHRVTVFSDVEADYDRQYG